jgi:hypothetical protein
MHRKGYTAVRDADAFALVLMWSLTGLDLSLWMLAKGVTHGAADFLGGLFLLYPE